MSKDDFTILNYLTGNQKEKGQKEKGGETFMKDECEELKLIRQAEELEGKMFKTRTTLKLVKLLKNRKREGFVEGQEQAFELVYGKLLNTAKAEYEGMVVENFSYADYQIFKRWIEGQLKELKEKVGQ